MDTVQQPHLRELLARLLDRTTESGRPLPRGAGRQVLPPGLPPRTARALPVGGPGRERAGRHLPGIDRDVAVTGALLHDIGKLEAYAWAGQAIELTDAGKLLGEIPLGYFRVRTGDRARSRASPPPAPSPCCTSSSATTASSSTAARSCPARARPRSSTSSTTSAATSGASTASRRASPTASAGRTSTAAISASAYFAPVEDEAREAA